MLALPRICLLVGLSLASALSECAPRIPTGRNFEGRPDHARNRRLPLNWSSTSNVVWKASIPGQAGLLPSWWETEFI